jgi:aminodeoxyfutalosine deaminase
MRLGFQESKMSQQRISQSYRVAWFVNGTLSMDDVTVRFADGRLLEVTSKHHDDAVDLGRVAMIPGLVNAHTHLEFSLLSEPISTSGRFTDWIRSVIAYRRAHPDVAGAAIRRGFAESLRAGTTLVGDIATTGWFPTDYIDSGFGGVVFQELLGLNPDRIAQQCELAETFSADSSFILDRASFPLHPGLSPHAPYSVHRDLFGMAIELAKRSSRPIAMHLAETEAELELLAQGTGEFREMLTEFGLWRDGLFDGGQRPMDYLEALAECPSALIVHGNYLNDDELQFVSAHPRMTLVYCPRTHAAFGHRDHPWRRVLELGGSVAIGTDSRASNPDLSIFAELQFLAARHRDMSHLDLLTVGSTSGRAALGFDVGTTGSSDFTVVALSDAAGNDPARGLFAAGNRVVGTIVDGHWRFADESIASHRGVAESR